MRRPRSRTEVLVAVLAAAVVSAGCTARSDAASSDSDHALVAPLPPSTAADEPGSSAEGVDADDRSTVDRPAGERDADATTTDDLVLDDPSIGGEATGGTADGRRRAAVVAGDVLDRYGQVLTELAADPALDLDRFATRWSTVADPASAFSQDMLRSLVARVRDDQMVVLPGPEGRSYVHRPVRITAVDDAAIAFTWCGYSPGVGVHVVTGAVLDDAVGHASGTGRLVRSGDRWLLDALDQEQLVALPPASPDPCADGGVR